MQQFNWTNLLSHPSEIIRVDEVLRHKQIELQTFSEGIDGWTKIAAQEVLEHKRLIYRMRCYLHISAITYFNHPVMSRESLKDLKDSKNLHGSNYISNKEDSLAILTATTPNQFWLIMSTTFDRENSLKFYKKLISCVLGQHYTCEEKEIMIDIIIKNCDFSIEND